MFSSRDPEFVMAQCRVWNDWAWEMYADYNDRISPVAQIGTQDVDLAVAEVERVAKMGFRTLSFPTKPIHGPGEPREINYNDLSYDRLWGAVQDTGLPMVFHIATGRDPRRPRGNGGSIINYSVHALAPAGETVANLCCSGVFERFPRLRFATIESGIGWVAWMLQVMDEAYRKQQFLMRPRLEEAPSVYYRRHGMATFQEDPPGLDLARDSTSWTTSCGPTTTRTTRGPGPSRRRPSSAPWASTTTSGPRCSGSTRRACSSSTSRRARPSPPAIVARGRLAGC